MRRRLVHRLAPFAFGACAVLLASACGGGAGEPAADTAQPVQPPAKDTLTGTCAVPAAARAADSSRPDHVVGNGSPQSCTSDAVVDAVAQGGVITFDCGAAPVTITMTRTAKVFNDRPDVVLDGAGLVTLSGGGARRILYQNTCDPAQVWTSSRCDLQDTPRLTVQNLTLADGDSSGQAYGRDDVYGGGAIYARGGRLKIVDSRFVRNRCEATGPDLGGAAVRAVGMPGGTPVYVVGSRFGGSAADGNQCANGAGLSGLGASFTVINSVFGHNQATGRGANPASAGTPGGGSGGAIYQDGNDIHLSLCGTQLHDNRANEGGGAVFFVSNNRSGTLSITDSLLEANVSAGFETAGLPGIFMLAASGQPVVSGSTLRP